MSMIPKQICSSCCSSHLQKQFSNFLLYVSAWISQRHHIVHTSKNKLIASLPHTFPITINGPTIHNSVTQDNNLSIIFYTFLSFIISNQNIKSALKISQITTLMLFPEASDLDQAFIIFYLSTSHSSFVNNLSMFFTHFPLYHWDI